MKISSIPAAPFRHLQRLTDNVGVLGYGHRRLDNRDRATVEHHGRIRDQRIAGPVEQPRGAQNGGP